MDKISVLIVDDNQTLVRLMVDFLSRKQDIEIVGTAKDGMEAVDLIASVVPDVVLMDIVMPRMDGFGAGCALAHEPWKKAARYHGYRAYARRLYRARHEYGRGLLYDQAL